jgi:hypothetical protein
MGDGTQRACGLACIAPDANFRVDQMLVKQFGRCIHDR